MAKKTILTIARKTGIDVYLAGLSKEIERH